LENAKAGAELPDGYVTVDPEDRPARPRYAAKRVGFSIIIH